MLFICGLYHYLGVQFFSEGRNCDFSLWIRSPATCESAFNIVIRYERNHCKYIETKCGENDVTLTVLCT